MKGKRLEAANSKNLLKKRNYLLTFGMIYANIYKLALQAVCTL